MWYFVASNSSPRNVIVRYKLLLSSVWNEFTIGMYLLSKTDNMYVSYMFFKCIKCVPDKMCVSYKSYCVRSQKKRGENLADVPSVTHLTEQPAIPVWSLALMNFSSGFGFLRKRITMSGLWTSRCVHLKIFTHCKQPLYFLTPPRQSSLRWRVRSGGWSRRLLKGVIACRYVNVKWCDVGNQSTTGIKLSPFIVFWIWKRWECPLAARGSSSVSPILCAVIFHPKAGWGMLYRLLKSGTCLFWSFPHANVRLRYLLQVN